MFVGQLIFGWLGDVLGRKRTCEFSLWNAYLLNSCSTLITYTAWADGLELMIMLVATFGQTVAAPSYGVSIVGTLIVWRYIVSDNVLSALLGDQSHDPVQSFFSF